ncbi:hypothetical protein BG015_011623 [Linnemannia schmuckeri]|uniref:HMG box domain-containing protein n=1 Tax=Linnemannia schmuckeri TaxID=64567 RepID=A0A9P5RUV5_9FUNG|nr:hypothetical protein BG015_011623 [Linnemannia schmuckeri]
MDSCNPSTSASFCPAIASSSQACSQTSTFSFHNADTLIKTEKAEGTITTNNFSEVCIEDHGLQAPFVVQVEGHSLGPQNDDGESNPCFSGPYLPKEAFNTSSFTRLFSNSVLYSEEHQDTGLGYQSGSFEYASQPARQYLHPLEVFNDSDVPSTTSFQSRPRQSNTISTPRLNVRPSTRSSSRLKNSRMGDRDLHDQEEMEEQQRGYRESSVTSTVTRRFSGLSLMPAVSSPLAHASIIPVSTLATAPTTSAAPRASTTSTAISSPATSAIYFPPTASALHQKRRKALKQELRVPRPKNCFMLYRSKVLPMIMAELGNINNKIISKIAAERWRAESEPVKTWYRDMAKYGKEEHARNNPGYKYAPLNKMRSIAATALSHLTQPQRSSKKVTAATRDSVDVDEDNNAGDEDYVDGSSSTRRRSARQRLQRQQPVTRSGLQSQVGKRRNSNLGTEIPSTSQAKKPKDNLDNHVSYHPLNFSTDSILSFASTETTRFPSFEQQYQHQEITYQAQPLAGPFRPLLALPYDASSATTSIYGLAGERNASEVTLVDPTDHWTTHRYYNAPSYSDHVNLSSTSTTLLSPNSGVQKSMMAAAASFVSPSKLMMVDHKILMEKELPPLPYEIAPHDSNNFHATNRSTLPYINNNDPNSILAQMFLDYNPHYQQHAQHHHQQQQREHCQHHQHQLSTTIGSSATTTFRPIESSFSALKEPQVSSAGVGMMNGNIIEPSSIRALKQEQVQVQQRQHQHTHEQNPFQQAFQQHTHQQQQAFHKQTQHQQQFQQYLRQQQQEQQEYGWCLRKPTGPAGPVSLAGAAAQGGPMFVTDFFSSFPFFK